MDSSLLTDGHGRTVGAYVIFKDVSNLRSLEEQVQRSDRLAMIGQIAAGTAHEIRNPLTSIKGFLQILKNSLSEKGMDKELSYTEIMLDEINRINGLVSEFLLLSKPKDTVFYKVNISTVINEILPIIRNEAILHNVTVEYESKTILTGNRGRSRTVEASLFEHLQGWDRSHGGRRDIDDPGKSGPGGRQGVCGHP